MAKLKKVTTFKGLTFYAPVDTPPKKGIAGNDMNAEENKTGLKDMQFNQTERRRPL